MLLDGHGSRTQHEFLEHVDDDDHRWAVCVGFPNGASLWQVHDSAEQNRHFNAEFMKAKADLVALKSSMSLNAKLTPTDTMLLINCSWNFSFGNVETNKVDIANRG